MVADKAYLVGILRGLLEALLELRRCYRIVLMMILIALHVHLKPHRAFCGSDHTRRLRQRPHPSKATFS